MTRLHLTFACGDYDRTRALAEDAVRPDGIDLTYLRLPVEETFFRMMRHQEFEVAELSLSSYVLSLREDPSPFVALPVFTSRMFRHGALYCHAEAGISRPEDLRGKRIGTPEYQLTACVWMRGIGAEAVLRLRAFLSNGDLDAYWRFHAACERQRLYPTPDLDQYEFMA
ncbi:hypothetical protein ABZ468_42050 [Streptomyces sp. NPDC005708]|uniref:hypothetical protein n=1 Tax=unclassified Streptomyces TaxID=2593676 RepID=UPI00340C9BA5